MTVEERIRVVLHEMQWSEADLKGKLILDAGCGNGSLSKALAERGATVVAIDLSSSVFRAQQHYGSAGLHFVQGNLFFPPFKREVFDAIYSCGVFHHTPDTRRCFDALIPTLKHDQHARFFVWLYSKRCWLFNATVEPLMKLTRKMPSRLLVPMCRALAGPVEVSSRLLTSLHCVDYAPRNLKDRAVQLHDLLSPPFVSYHSYDEAQDGHSTGNFRASRGRRTRYLAAAVTVWDRCWPSIVRSADQGLACCAGVRMDGRLERHERAAERGKWHVPGSRLAENTDGHGLRPAERLDESGWPLRFWISTARRSQDHIWSWRRRLATKVCRFSALPQGGRVTSGF